MQTTLDIPPDSTPSVAIATGAGGVTARISTDADRVVIHGTPDSMLTIARALLPTDRTWKAGQTFTYGRRLLVVQEVTSRHVLVADSHGTTLLPIAAASAAVAVGLWEERRPLIVGGDEYQVGEGTVTLSHITGGDVWYRIRDGFGAVMLSQPLPFVLGLIAEGTWVLRDTTLVEARHDALDGAA